MGEPPARPGCRRWSKDERSTKSLDAGPGYDASLLQVACGGEDWDPVKLLPVSAA